MVKEVILIVGPTRSGKTFLQEQFKNEGYHKIISATTRQPRDGEVEGVDYFFNDSDSFHKLDFVEKEQFGQNWYGTPIKEFQYEKVVHVVEPKGALSLKRMYPFSKIIFLDISSEEINLNEGSTDFKRNQRENILLSDITKECHPDLIIKKRSDIKFEYVKQILGL